MKINKDVDYLSSRQYRCHPDMPVYWEKSMSPSIPGLQTNVLEQGAEIHDTQSSMIFEDMIGKLVTNWLQRIRHRTMLCCPQPKSIRQAIPAYRNLENSVKGLLTRLVTGLLLSAAAMAAPTAKDAELLVTTTAEKINTIVDGASTLLCDRSRPILPADWRDSGSRLLTMILLPAVLWVMWRVSVMCRVCRRESARQHGPTYPSSGTCYTTH